MDETEMLFSRFKCIINIDFFVKLYKVDVELRQNLNDKNR